MPRIARIHTGAEKPNYALLWRTVAAQDAARTVRLQTDAGVSTSDLWAALTGDIVRAVNAKWIARYMAARMVADLQRDDLKQREAMASQRYRERRSKGAPVRVAT